MNHVLELYIRSCDFLGKVGQSRLIFAYNSAKFRMKLANSRLKNHINFFNINFLPPPKTPHFGTPEKKLMYLNSWERTTKRDPHKLFQGDFLGQTGVPNRPFSATKSLVYCFFRP